MSPEPLPVRMRTRVRCSILRGRAWREASSSNVNPATFGLVASTSSGATRLASRNLFEDLTPRELQVLEQMAKVLANKEIADVLKITGHTVKDHLKNILGKLHVADRTEAVTVAIQRGIIHL